MAFAISRSELLPFSRKIAAFGLGDLESISGSVDYAVASGVTATIGYTDVSASNENASVSGNSGSAWYIGANISF